MRSVSTQLLLLCQSLHKIYPNNLICRCIITSQRHLHCTKLTGNFENWLIITISPATKSSSPVTTTVTTTFSSYLPSLLSPLSSRFPCDLHFPFHPRPNDLAMQTVSMQVCAERPRCVLWMCLHKSPETCAFTAVSGNVRKHKGTTTSLESLFGGTCIIYWCTKNKQESL